eukprot:TRINITY_DN12791_c0_g1_i2.p1 TRINITY_DN12791_c0_g1~~TRINITY_DN12791_c0_g1_i2.p1  ORF type:complete len:226 (+),score=25.79 TRINITY_DN12791_c0_g1_i2:610-1287(+)
MTYIVVYQQVGWINIFSITLSLISVASKSVLLSYCVDRATFVFNILCFVTDLFSVFVSVSLLFFIVPSFPTHSVWFLTIPVSLLSAIWFHLHFVLWWSCFVGALGMSVYLICEQSRYVNRWSDVVNGCLAYCVSALLFLPALILVSGVKFALIPLLAFKTLRANAALPGLPDLRIVSFVKGGGWRWLVWPSKDLLDRLWLTSRALCWHVHCSHYGDLPPPFLLLP